MAPACNLHQVLVPCSGRLTPLNHAAITSEADGSAVQHLILYRAGGPHISLETVDHNFLLPSCTPTSLPRLVAFRLLIS